MHIRHGDFRRQFCTNPIRSYVEAGEPWTALFPQRKFYRTTIEKNSFFRWLGTMKDYNAGDDKAREFLRPYSKSPFSARVVSKTGGTCRRREGPRQVPGRE